MSGAWSKGTNKAVVNAPSGGRVGGDGSGRSNNNNNRRNHNNNNSGDGGDGGDFSGRGGRGRGRGGGRGRGRGSYDNNNNGGRGGRGRGRNNYDNNNKNARRGNQNNNGSIHQRIVIKDVQLLEVTGTGGTPAQKAVKRISAKILIMARTKYLEAPGADANGVELFQPHTECRWTDDDRAEIINQSSMKVMELGDVSKNPNAKSKNNKDTAPPLEECKPLVVNEETRWKSKAMKKSPSSANLETTDKDEESNAKAVANKALLILNKISWTTMDRLTKQLVDETKLVENEEVKKELISTLIGKAQTEQHFGPMYAQLCSIISKEFKPFKKDLLEQCQGEFETDTAEKIAVATKTTDGTPMDNEEVQYHSMLIRKAYVGHIKFLGELYLRDVVKLSVMTYCLDELLKDESSEENLECFVHLMTTMGEKLVGHSKKKNNKPFDWGHVLMLSKSANISNRIKFMFEGLLELKDRGWVQRRKMETAKSIADLHKELAKEEKNQRRNSSLSISTSQSNLKRSSSLAAAAAPSMDNDGFMEISRLNMKKVGSRTNIPSGAVETVPSVPSKPKGQKLRRAQSTPAAMSTSFTIGTPSSTPIKQKSVSNNNMTTAPSLPAAFPLEGGNLLSIEQCQSKMKSILKEYFVGGDTADAVLSVHEMIQVGSKGSIERGAKAFESGVLMVMEMKEASVNQLLTIFESCVKDSKIENEAIVQGLNDPIEFLRDIQIDAPLAASHLSLIIFKLISWNAISFDFLLGTPEFFRTDGRPAAFAIEILKKKSDPSDDELRVVESLMTEDDKKAYASAKVMFDVL